MVYRGLPSKGCFTCRRRKVKVSILQSPRTSFALLPILALISNEPQCDQTLPVCNNCTNLKRPCLGYRDPTDLIFLNENEATARKVEARSVAQGRPIVTKLRSSGSVGSAMLEGRSHVPRQHDSGVDPSPISLSIMPNLTPTIDERAVNFFFSNHVIGIGLPSTGFIDQMHTHPDYDFSDNLLSSIKAVGLAGVFNVTKAPGLLVEASKQYVTAVRHLNAALQSPVEVKKDTTLMAVMVLGIFETLVGRSENSLVAWAAHLNGAAALMKIRGPEQMKTVAGRRLFAQITGMLATSCLQQETELPEHIFELRLELDKYVDIKNIIWESHHVLIRFTNLYSAVKRDKLTDLREILSQSLDLDKKLVQVFSVAAEDWTFSTIYTDNDPELIYNGRFHVYQHALSAQVWNGMRAMRIMLNEMIRNVLLTGFSLKPPLFVLKVHTEQLQTSTDVLYQISSDIISSVPQYLGYNFKGNLVSPDSSFMSPEPVLLRNPGRDMLADLKTSSVPLFRTAGYQLPWALFLVGVTDVVTEPILRWVIKMLKQITRVLGIQQATVLAERLELTRLPMFSENM